MELPKLVVELVGDYDQLLKDINTARQAAINNAKLLEKDFKKYGKITIGVDDSELTALNQHLKVKVQHYNQQSA
jgi:hypothetical protein